MLNCKLDTFVCRVDSFSPKIFQNLMITHERTSKTILGETRGLLSDQDKLIDEVTLKVQTALNTSNNA